MKSFLISILLISFLYSTSLIAQDIKAKLSGHQATNGFTVIDDEDKVLFKVTGDGNVGINTDSPSGILDVQGGSTSLESGRSINIVAEAGQANGGTIILQGGKEGSKIVVAGGTNSGMDGGDLYLLSGAGSDYAGDINIISGADYLYGNTNAPSDILSSLATGDINIHTGTTNHQGGKISIYTEQDNTGGSSIEIYTQGSGDLTSILLEAGRGSSYGGNVELKTTNGGDIVINPNSSNLLILNGSGTYSGTWTQASDERYKKNVKPLDNSLDKIKQLNSVMYEWRKEEYPEKNFRDGEQVGLIAQDVEKVIPELVSTDSESYKSIDYTKINVFLIEAIKEQQKSIEELKKEVAELRSKLTNDVSLNSSTVN